MDCVIRLRSITTIDFGSTSIWSIEKIKDDSSVAVDNLYLQSSFGFRVNPKGIRGSEDVNFLWKLF